MTYAVRWHDAERLATEFALIPAWETKRGALLRDALQLALELQHERCVKVCIKNAAPVNQISLLGLYDLLFDEAMNFHFATQLCVGPPTK